MKSKSSIFICIQFKMITCYWNMRKPEETWAWGNLKKPEEGLIGETWGNPRKPELEETWAIWMKPEESRAWGNLRKLEENRGNLMKPGETWASGNLRTLELEGTWGNLRKTEETWGPVSFSWRPKRKHWQDNKKHTMKRKEREMTSNQVHKEEQPTIMIGAGIYTTNINENAKEMKKWWATKCIKEKSQTMFLVSSFLLLVPCCMSMTGQRAT